MHAIEFHTTIKEGVIAIPPEHLPLLSGGSAKVIVVPDAQPASPPTSSTSCSLIRCALRASGRSPETKRMLAETALPSAFIDTNIWLYAFIEVV
jgi:hypothetical protein